MDNKDNQESTLTASANQNYEEEHVNTRFVSSIRRMSLTNSDEVKHRRKRSSSECTLETNTNLNYQNEIDNISLKPRTGGTFASLFSGVQRRATSLIFGDQLTRKYEENLMSASLHDVSMELQNQQSEPSDLTHGISFSESSRGVTQTDHLNKRLLDSFLSRINSISSAIVDPTGENDGANEVYTDDLLMDRILHRVESGEK